MRTLQFQEVECVNGGWSLWGLIKDALTFGGPVLAGVIAIVKDGDPPPTRTDEMGNNY
jgi:hypothetical protein